MILNRSSELPWGQKSICWNMLPPFPKCLNYLCLKVCKVCSLGLHPKSFFVLWEVPPWGQRPIQPCLCSVVQTELVLPKGRMVAEARKEVSCQWGFQNHNGPLPVITSKHPLSRRPMSLFFLCAQGGAHTEQLCTWSPLVQGQRSKGYIQNLRFQPSVIEAVQLWTTSWVKALRLIPSKNSS